jgi:hypothetical protein
MTLTTKGTTRDGRAELREQRQVLLDQRNKLRADRDTANQLFVERPTKERAQELSTIRAKLERVEDDLGSIMDELNDGLKSINNGAPISTEHRLAESMELLATLAEHGSSTQLPFTPVGEVLSRDEFIGKFGNAIGGSGRLWAADTGITTVPDGSRTGGHTGFAVSPVPPLTLLDLFASVPGEGSSQDFMRRGGNLIASAGIQSPEGGVKAAADLTWDEVNTKFMTVASWSKAELQKLADIEGLEQEIGNALQYGVRYATEQFLLTGYAPAGITGLINTTGILAPDVSGQNTVTGKVLLAVAALTSIGVLPNFVALNPVTYAGAILARSGGSGELESGSPWTNPGNALYGVPTVQSPAIEADHALIGDSRIAAVWRARSGLNTVVGQESDDLIKNRVTVLVEHRGAPEVRTPSALAYIDVTTT